MNDKERHERQKHFISAVEYVSGRLAPGKKGNDKNYPLNRGDIIVLVKLINQQMEADPSASKRLAALRGKLGDLVFDAPQMSKEEAKEFKD